MTSRHKQGAGEFHGSRNRNDQRNTQTTLRYDLEFNILRPLKFQIYKRLRRITTKRLPIRP